MTSLDHLSLPEQYKQVQQWFSEFQTKCIRDVNYAKMYATRPPARLVGKLSMENATKYVDEVTKKMVDNQLNKYLADTAHDFDIKKVNTATAIGNTAYIAIHCTDPTVKEISVQQFLKIQAHYTK